MKNDFNRVAASYGYLSKLVFGQQLIKAQCTFLSDIPEGAKVLIVGGGNGEILDHLSTDSLEIDFVELSEKMISLAKKRTKTSPVKFIQVDFMQHLGQYDVVMANFFLDCFDEASLGKVVGHLVDRLRENGMLLITDFQQTSSPIHRFLNRSMHEYFRLLANLEAKNLLDIRDHLNRDRLRLEDIEYYRRKHIFSAKYRVIS